MVNRLTDYGYDLHVGGLAALSLSGHARYLPAGSRENRLSLFGKSTKLFDPLPLTARLFIRQHAALR